MPCEFCDDTGWRPVETNGVRQVQRCQCRSSKLGQQRMASANIPIRYRHCTIDKFKAYNESLIEAAGRARHLVEDFPVSPKGLLLQGRPGVGKTHLAVAILRQVIEKNNSRGVFYDTRELLRVIRSTYDPSIRTTEIEILRPVMQADLLVLDDLGAEKTSEWVEETMNLIVNTRYNERRLTIFTTNYLDSEDEKDRPFSLLERIGYRMRSRLYEMCDTVVMEALDHREQPEGVTSSELMAKYQSRDPEKKALPSFAKVDRQARARLRRPADDGKADLKWSGGKAGT